MNARKTHAWGYEIVYFLLISPRLNQNSKIFRVRHMHIKKLILSQGVLLTLGIALLLGIIIEPIKSQILKSDDNLKCKVPVAGEKASDKGKVDYRELCSLLTAQKYEEANLKTEELMLQAVDRKPDELLAVRDIKAFPCKDLNTIDQLWLQHSRNHFGITTQKEIWIALGNSFGQENSEDYDRFTQVVGWMDGSRMKLLREDDFGFGLNQSKGHLPILPKAASLYSAAHLVSRAKVCSV